jgi:hypothetical protein
VSLVAEELKEFREPVVRFYPTTVRFPAWLTRLVVKRPPSLSMALSSLRVGDFSVRRISEGFTLRGLMKSPLRPDLRVVLHPAEVVEEVRVVAPVDGSEVVEWMQVAAAENIVMQARIAEYNALGSQLVGGSDDPYIPGLVVEDIVMENVKGSTVSSRGYASVSTPRGSFNVPRMEKSTGVFRDLLTWGSISYIGVVQYIGNLLKWKSLAETPIRQTVGFYMDSAGNIAPHFFVQMPPRPALTVRARLVVESGDKQSLTITFRDPSDYTRALSTRKVDLQSGGNQIEYTLSAFPYVPPVVAEIQPENNKQTKLNEYTVS